MSNNIQVCELTHTPFLIMSRDRKTFVVGRTDTNEVLSIGSFNKSFADEFDENEFLFLKIKGNGTAEEIFSDEQTDDPSKFISLQNDTAIVAAKIGSYWLTPVGFDEWAKKVFPETV